MGPRLFLILMAVVFFLLSHALAFAEPPYTFTWTGSEGDDGDKWARAANWAGPGGMYPDDPYDLARFEDPSGKRMPVQNASMSNGLGRLEFAYNGWTINVGGHPIRLNSSQYFQGIAIISGGTGSAGVNVIYPAVELLNSSQVIRTHSGSTLIIAGGFQGSYTPIIDSANPTNADTGAVRIDAASALTAPIYLRQGSLLLRHSLGLGGSSDPVNIGGDSQVVNGAWARLLTDQAGLVVSKPIHVRSLANHNVQAVLGGTHSEGLSSFTGAIVLELPTRLTAEAGGQVNFSGNISGSSGIIKVGDGRVLLSGNNSYTGLTEVQSGVLIVASSSALGSTSAGTVVLLPAQLRLDGSGGNLTIGEPLSLAGMSQQNNTGALRNIAGNNVLTGPVTLTAPTRISQGGGNLTLSGGISGNHPLTLTVDTGGLTISGSPVNIGNQNLQVQGPGSVVLGSSGNSFGQLQVTGGGMVKTAADAALPTAARIVLGDSSTSGKLDLQGHSQTVAGLESGGLHPNNLVTSSSAATLEVDLPAGSSAAYSGRIAGQVSLTKKGPGTQTLSGQNDFVGAVSVEGGILEIGHTQALGASSVGTTVSSAGQLRLNPSGTGITLAEPLNLAGTAQQLGTGALVNAAGQNQLQGAVTLSGETRISQLGGSLQITGGIAGSHHLHLNAAVGQLQIASQPINLGPQADLFIEGAGGSVLLGVGGNIFRNLIVQGNGTLYLGAAGAVPDSAVLTLGDSSGGAGRVNLSGFDLTVSKLEMLGGGNLTEITTGPSATLTISGGQASNFAGRLRGELNLNISKGAQVTLSGDNDYRGLTTVSEGRLVVASDSALGSAQKETVVDRAGQLALSGGAKGLLLREPLTLQGKDQYAGTGALVNERGNNQLAGPISLGDETRVTVSDGNLTISGGITGSADLHVFVPRANARLTVTGQPLSLPGQRVVVEGKDTSSAGTVELASVAAKHNFAGIQVGNYATLVTSASEVLPSDCAVQLGSSSGRPGHWDLAGTRQMVSRVSATTPESTIGSTKPGAELTVTVNDTVRFPGRLHGGLSLTKSGPGNLVLSNDSNSHTGSTTVQGGTLTLLGQHQGGDVYKVLMNAVLAGTGATASDVQTWGSLAPGNPLDPNLTVGTLSVGSLTLHGGSRILWELRDPQDDIQGWDRLLVTGVLTISASVDQPIELVLISTDDYRGRLAMGMEIPFLSFSGGISGFDSRFFRLDTSQLRHPVDGPLFITLSDNSLRLSVSPEPASIALAGSLAGAGAVALIIRRRRAHTYVKM